MTAATPNPTDPPGTVHRPRTRRDEGAALALTLFLIMMIGTLSITVAGAVLVQTKPTQVQQKNTVTVAAAEAGIDVALNRLRAASDGLGAGILAQLPCTSASGTVLTGAVGPGATAAQYSVTIRYYAADPSQQSDAWRSTNAQGCTTGHPTVVPLYALLESSGSATGVPGLNAGDANRAIEATYQFKTTNQNIPGGALPIFFNNAITSWCIAVDSATIGAQVKLRACSGADTQKWSYTKDLLLQMQDSTGHLYCLDRNGSATRLSACDANDVTEIWGYDGSKQFEGGTAVNGQLTGSCLYVDSVSDNASLKYGSCGAQVIPDAKVGPGRAGEDMSQTDGSCRDGAGNLSSSCTFQIVNYKYFGRCIDMTHASTSSTWMIGYVCKEVPGTQYLAWNQRFFWDSTNGMFCTNTNGTVPTTCGVASSTLYCLYAGTTSANSPAGTRVVLKLCNKTDASQKWARRFDTGVYASSWNVYTVREGLCLELSPNYPPEAAAIDRPWGMIIINTCDGSTQQKWNAPADLESARMTNTHEQLP